MTRWTGWAIGAAALALPAMAIAGNCDETSPVPDQLRCIQTVNTLHRGLDMARGGQYAAEGSILDLEAENAALADRNADLAAANADLAGRLAALESGAVPGLAVGTT